MFTGLVQEKGRVISLLKVNEWWELTLEGLIVLERVALGYSIAVNGVCLTVSSFSPPMTGKLGTFTAKLLPETQRVTNLMALAPGDLVNMERAVAVGDYLGGHIMQGHIDQACPILSLVRDGGALQMRIALPQAYRACYFPKGAVCVDGVSLTIMAVDTEAFTVSLVEETQKRVTLADKKVGDTVNLEADCQAKLVATMAPKIQVEEDLQTKMKSALQSFKNGGFVIVMDDYHRENEGDLIISAAKVTSEQIAFMISKTTGILCAPMSKARAEKLSLPLMVQDNTDPNKTAFTVTVDAIATGTGVSALDRCTTFRFLADEASSPNSFRRPGHIFPLIARPGGVKERRGHTEASIELCKLTGLPEVAAIGELQKKDGSMYRLPDCRKLAKKYDIPIISVDEIARYLYTQ